MTKLTPAHPHSVEPELDRYCQEKLNDKMWVVCCISNPARFKTRYALYRKFRRHVLEDLRLPLLTVECALNNSDFQVTQSRCDDENRHHTHIRGQHNNGVEYIDVRVRNSSWVWLKECLWNIGVQNLPIDCKYVLFCDADIQFDNVHIAHEIIVALQTYKVVQPFYHCLDLGPRGEVLQVHQSFMASILSGLEWRMERKIDSRTNAPYYGPKQPRSGIAIPFHPGYCMAFRRSVLNKLPLLDVGILGAGDHHMCGSLVGRYEQTLPKGIHPNYARAVKDWQDRAQDIVRGDYGYVDGTIRHFWHGSKAKRRYVQRWSVLVDHAYDPARDSFKNGYGVLELRHERIGLRDDIRRYLTQRDEDANTIE